LSVGNMRCRRCPPRAEKYAGGFRKIFGGSGKRHMAGLS
jgi:hypothetical protein